MRVRTEDPQENQIGSVAQRSYNLLNYRRRNVKQKSSFSKCAKTLACVLMVGVMFTALVSLFYLISTNSGPKNQNNTVVSSDASILQSSVVQQQQQPQTDSKINENVLKHLYEVQQKLAKAQSTIQKLQSWKEKAQANLNPSNKQSKLSKIQISGTDSAALTQMISKQLGSHKTMIDFLHMQARERHFYQKHQYLKRVQQASGFLRGTQKARIAFLLSSNNFKIPHSNIHIERQIKGLLDNEYNRLSKQYDFNLEEKSFCLVVPTINNAKQFRYQYNLQSMMNLNYKNFKIVIVDDASTDNTYQLIKQFIAENPIPQTIHVIKNTQHMTAVPNIHKAITGYCDKDDIAVLIDGDDEVIGRHALKVFNHVYHKDKADVVWSNHIQFYRHQNNAHRGWSMPYSQGQKEQNRYRDVPQRIAHLRSFKVKLFLNIKEADLKEHNGEWFKSTYDEVICLPILEMSCGRNVYVDEYFYLYNFGIGTNDLQVDGGLQKRIADQVKFKRTKYGCLKE